MSESDRSGGAIGDKDGSRRVVRCAVALPWRGVAWRGVAPVISQAPSNIKQLILTLSYSYFVCF
jgi:hypothetical protein